MAYFVQNSSLIIFMKSILVYLVPPTQKLAWNCSKSPKIREKWRFPGKRKWFRENGSDHEIGNWILIQKKSIWGHFWEIFIQSWKNWQSMDRFSEVKIKCLKSGSKRAYLIQNFSLIIFMKSILVYLVPPTHKLAKTFRKIDF